MKSEDLLRAIGQMDEEYLARGETDRNSPKRIVWKVLLTAAIVASFVLTAVAAASTLWGKTRVAHDVSRLYMDGSMVETGEHSRLNFYVDLPVDEDAPNEIEQFYLPSILSTEDLTNGGIGADVKPGDPVSVMSMTWMPAQLGQYEFIHFRQMSGGDYQGDQPVESLDIFPITVKEVACHTEIVQWDGFEGVLFRLENWNEYYANTCYLFWTDSSYVYMLQYPPALEKARVREIVESIAPVEDIQPYLDTLTAHRKQTWQRFADAMPERLDYAFHAQADGGWLEDTKDTGLQVRLKLPLHSDAQERIANIIYPRYFDNEELFLQAYSWDEQGITSYTVACRMQEHELQFTQMGGLQYRNSGRVRELSVTDAQGMKSVRGERIVWGEDTFYQVSYAQTNTGKRGYRILYWTDGIYFYSLKCPCDMEDAEILKILESIR